MAGILFGMLVSCDRKDQPAAADSPAAPPKQGFSATNGGAGEAGEREKPKPSKAGDRPVLVEKKPPVAEPVPGQPGFVKSPYNGKIIDVKGIPAGSLVADPTYPAEEKKHFRVPEMPEAPAEPPEILDPSILIDPQGKAIEDP